MVPSAHSSWLCLAAALLGALLPIVAAGCGRSETDRTPIDPSPQAPTITLSATGAAPRAIDIAVGSRVRFVNTDSVAHTINSDPHPEHDECPELNQVGFLAPGQTRETGNFVQPEACGFHDQAFANEAFWGRITIR